MSTPAEKLLAKAIHAEANTLGDKHCHARELIRVLARLVEGKTIDQAMGAPGAWGYGTPLGDALFALLKEPEPARAPTIQWHYVTDKLPDDDTAILIACHSSGQPGEAVHDNGVFLHAGSDIVIPDVYAWADLPEIPQPKGGA